MSTDAPPPAPESPPRWPALSLKERRVLGVLVEKAKTTPDTYPLSLNSLVTGCNQKSNRDPVLDLSDAEVEDALAGMQKQGLVIKITGGRVERWRHNLYDAWKVDKVELAVLAELLLRGPQTEGELRSRASRMEPIEDLDALRRILRLLTDRRLTVYLTPEGRRGTMLSHGFHADQELERLRARHGSAAEGPADAPERPAERPAPTANVEKEWEERRLEMAEMRDRIAALEAAVAELKETVRSLREALGA